MTIVWRQQQLQLQLLYMQMLQAAAAVLVWRCYAINIMLSKVNIELQC